MAPVVGRIRRRASFRALARPDGRATEGPLTVAYTKMVEVPGLPVVGYAIGRRVGPAVVRNRLRRRLRAAAAASGPSLPAGAYLVRAGPPAVGLPFAELQRTVHAVAAAAASRSGPDEPGKTEVGR
jgi:ribonuclease P protein component